MAADAALSPSRRVQRGFKRISVAVFVVVLAAGAGVSIINARDEARIEEGRQLSRAALTFDDLIPSTPSDNADTRARRGEAIRMAASRLSASNAAWWQALAIGLAISFGAASICMGATIGIGWIIAGFLQD